MTSYASNNDYRLNAGWAAFVGLVGYAFFVHILLLIDTQPIEYREGGVLYATYQLKAGINIYDFARQPYDLNVYGFFYNAIVAMASPLLGIDFLAHRVVSAAFILLSCAAIAWPFRDRRNGIAFALIIGAVWYFQSLRLYGVGARPDTMAQFFYLLSVLVPGLYRFSNKSIVFSALCSLLAFFTKPYLAAGFGCAIGYLLLRRRWRVAITASALYLLVFCSLLLFTAKFGNAYLYDTVFVNLGYAGGWNWPHFNKQTLRFLAINAPLILAITYASFISRRSKDSHSTTVVGGDAKDLPNKKYLWWSSLMAFVLLVRISHNAGSSEYFVHLLTPIFILAGYQYLALRNLMPLALAAGLLQLAILAPRIPASYESEWLLIEKAIAEQKSVLHSPSTVRFALSRGEIVFDSGQTEFFQGGLKQGQKYYPEAAIEWKHFQDDLESRVATQQFSLLLLNRGMPAILDRQQVQLYYHLCGTLPAPMYRNPENTLELWKPDCSAS